MKNGIASAGFTGLTMTLAFFVPAAVSTDDLKVAAQVDKKEVAAGELLTYAVTIAGTLRESPKVQLTQFEGFQVVATAQAQQIQIEKGQPRQSLTLTYTLAPTEPGVHKLGPVKVDYQGKSYETQPIEVTVLAGPAKKKELEGGTIL